MGIKSSKSKAYQILNISSCKDVFKLEFQANDQFLSLKHPESRHIQYSCLMFNQIPVVSFVYKGLENT